MKPPEEKPTIELPIHGPQGTVYLAGSAINKAGGDEEYLESFFEECQEAGYHRKRALLNIAREFVKIDFSDNSPKGPDQKPEIQITSEDGEKSIRAKTTAALGQAGASDDFRTNFVLETAFCESREEMENVCGNYVQIK